MKVNPDDDDRDDLLEHLPFNGMGAALASARLSVKPFYLGGGQWLIPAHDGRYEVHDTVPEHLRHVPQRHRGLVELYTADSLVSYVLRHDMAGFGVSASLWSDSRTAAITAVLNDHSRSDAGWGDWRAVFSLRETPEWQAWKALDGRIGGQDVLAEHIEDHIGDITSPPGAEMLELAQTFHATTSVVFASQRLLDSGQRQLTYREDVEARAGTRGDIVIPREFTLALAAFEGEVPSGITARLRYRLTDGKLKIGYVLQNPERFRREAFGTVVARVAEELARPVLAGRHEPVEPLW